MATYNGSKYLSEQIESIICQSHQNWKLIISDDGSSDSTIEIIEHYAAKEPRIEVVNLPHESNCASANFFSLLQASQADYIMYADQDDVWLFDKIELEINAMQKLEAKFGSIYPLLVFTDSVIVDEDLNLINASCSSAKPYDSSKITFEQLLFNNVGQGCTMLFNRALVLLILNNPMDPVFLMHDYWTIMLASFYGSIYYLDQATVLYRQHSNNVYGINYAKQTAKMGFLHMIKNPSILNGWLKRLSISEKEFQIRAKALANCFGRDNSDNQCVLDDLCRFDTLNPLKKLNYICKKKLIRNQRNIYMQLCQFVGLMLYK